MICRQQKVEKERFHKSRSSVRALNAACVSEDERRGDEGGLVRVCVGAAGGTGHQEG